MVLRLKQFIVLVTACSLLLTSTLVSATGKSEDDKCFACCAYQDCADGYQCCGCPSVCECCDEYYQCAGPGSGPYSCVSPPGKPFIAALRKQHLKKSTKQLPKTPVNMKPQIAEN